MLKPQLYFATLVSLLLAGHVEAYDSTSNNAAHGNLTERSLNRLSSTHPDMVFFRNTILNAIRRDNWPEAVLEVEGPAHDGDPCANGGNALLHWEKALLAYLHGPQAGTSLITRFFPVVFPFQSVPDPYVSLGYIVHLTQDMTVPAHAFNIPHGHPIGALFGCGTDLFLGADNFEVFAEEVLVGLKSEPATLPPVSSIGPPYNHYVSALIHTINIVNHGADGQTPPNYCRKHFLGTCTDEVHFWRDYWSEGEYPNRTFLGLTNDIFPSDNADLVENNENGADFRELKLAQHLWADAVRYGEAVLRYASEQLPPILSDVELPSSIAQKSPAPIKISIADNRSQKVHLGIFVNAHAISATGPSGQRTFDGQSDGSVVDLSPGSKMPFETTLVLSWDGLLADGTYLPRGAVGVFDVTVRDGDNNGTSFQAGKQLTVRAPAFSAPGQVQMATPFDMNIADQAPPRFRAGGNLGTPGLKVGAFSQHPNVTGFLNTGRIEAKFDEPVNWTLTLDPDRTDRKTDFSGSGTAMQVDWDGVSWPAGQPQVVEEGVHTYRLRFTDFANPPLGPVPDPPDGLIVLDNTLPVLTLDSPAPKHFSPNGDGKKDEVTVPYTFSDAPDRLPIQMLDVVGEVVDAGGRVVRVITPAPQSANSPANPYGLTWDGKTNQGVVAAEGAYTLRISVTDNAGNRTTRTSAPFVLDVTPPALTNTFASPFVVTPEGVSARVTRAFPTLNDNLAELVVLTADIVDGDRTVVTQHLNEWQNSAAFRSLGPVTLKWDGMGDPGQPVPDDGPYYFRLVTRDDADNETVTYIPVVRNNVPLRISVPDGQTLVTATLDDDGFVVIQGTAVSVTGFASYRLDYALGTISEAEQAMADWRPIPVPANRQTTNDIDYPNSPISLLPVQGQGAVLARWDTKGLDDLVTLRLTVADKSGAVRRLLQTVTIQNPFFLYGLDASPPIFSPISDQALAQTTLLRFVLSKEAAVVIRARRLPDTTPVDLASFPGTKGSNEFRWDGRLGAAMPQSGQYRLEIEATEASGVPRVATVDVTIPETFDGALSASLNTVVSPVTQRRVIVTGAVSPAAKLWWLGYRIEGQTAERWVLLASGTASPPNPQATWRVDDLSGAQTLGLTVADGLTSFQATRGVVVQLPLLIQQLLLTPDPQQHPYDPTVGRMHIRYRLAEPAHIRITVESAQGGAQIAPIVLRDEIGSTQPVTKEGEVAWDGVGANGFLVLNSTYVVKVAAARLGSSEVVGETSQGFAVDASRFDITDVEVVPRIFDPTSPIPERRAAQILFRTNRPALAGYHLHRPPGGSDIVVPGFGTVSPDSDIFLQGADPIRVDSRPLDPGMVTPRSVRVYGNANLQSLGELTVVLEVTDPTSVVKVTREIPGVFSLCGSCFAIPSDVTAAIATPTEDAIVDRALGKSGTFFSWHAAGTGLQLPNIPFSGFVFRRGAFGIPFPAATFNTSISALTGTPEVGCGPREISTGFLGLFTRSFSQGDDDPDLYGVSFGVASSFPSDSVAIDKQVTFTSLPPGPGGTAPPLRVTVSFLAHTGYSRSFSTPGINSKVPATIFLPPGESARTFTVPVNILAQFDKPGDVVINHWPTLDVARPWDGKPHDGLVVDRTGLDTGPNCGTFNVRLSTENQKRTLEIYGIVGGLGFSRYVIETTGESTGGLLELIGEGNVPVGISGMPGLLGRWDITGRFGDHKILLSVFNQKNEVLTTARQVHIGDLIEADQDAVQIAGSPQLETKAYFPPGSLPAGSRALVQLVPRSATTEEVQQVVDRSGLTLAGPVVEIQVRDLKTGGSTLIFSADQPVTLTYQYDPADLTPAQENQLGIYRLKSDGTLEFLDGFVDTVNHTVTVNITHFSTYVLARDPRRPAPPDLDPVPALVTTASLPLTGRAEPGVIVEAQRAGNTVSVSIPTAPPTQVSQPAVPFVLPPVPLMEGDNEIRVVARNRANHLSDPPVIVHVRRDTQAPRVTVLEAGPSAIAPDRSGQPQVFSIRFQATEPGTAFLTIRDTQGVVVGAEPATVSQAGHPVALSWNGRGSDGQFVADGVSAYQLDVLDDAGNRAQDVALLRGQIGVDRTAPVVADLFAEPAVFAPDGFSGRASAQVRYTVRDAVSATVRLAIRVLRTDETEVRMLEMDRVQAVGAGTVTWDGRDVTGQTVVDGGYLVEIVATDEAGNQGAAARVPITVDRRPALDVETVAAVPNGISPNGDQSQDTTELRYTLRRPAKVGIVIQQAVPLGTTLIRELQVPVLQVPGAYAVTWDGAAVGGAALPDGTYNLVLTATDEQGATLVRTVPVVLDRDAPVAVWNTPAAGGSALQGLVTLRGTATDAHPSGFEITFGLGDTPSTFGLITTDSRTVTDGLLGYWDTNGLKGPGVVRLAVTDAAGNRTVAVQPVLLDNPTSQFLIQLEPRGPLAFSPNGDGRQDTVQIGYRLRWDATVDAQVMVAGVPVSLLGPVDQLPGESAFTVSWDGKTSGGDRAPPGDYVIQLHAKAIHLPLDETRLIPVTLALDGPSAVLTTPSSGAVLRQPIEVVGTATAPLFREYRLEANADPTAGPWQPLVVGRAVQSSGVLGTVDPTVLPPGPARVRLVVDDMAGLSSVTEVAVAADNRGVAAEWLAPAENAVVSGDVSLRGTVGALQLANYEVAVAPGATDPSPPASVFKGLKTGSVPADPLVVWKTKDFTSEPMFNGGFETFVGPVEGPTFPGWTLMDLTANGNVGVGTLMVQSGAGRPQGVFEGLHSAMVTLGFVTSESGAIGQAALVSDPFVSGGGNVVVRLRGEAGGASLGAGIQVLKEDGTGETLSVTPGPDWTTYQVNIDQLAGQRVRLQIGMSLVAVEPEVAGLLFIDGIEASQRTEIREAEGPAVLRLRAIGAGGQQVEATRRVTVDNIPPVVQLDGLGEGAVLSGVVEVRGTVTDPHLERFLVEFVPDGGGLRIPIGGGRQSVEHGTLGQWDTIDQDGTGTLVVTAGDRGGNEAVVTRRVTVQTGRPFGRLIAPANASLVRGLVSIQGQVGATSAGLENYELRLGAGLSPRTFTTLSTGADAISGQLLLWDSRSVPDGAYALQLLVRANGGRTADESRTIVVVDNEPAVLKVVDVVPPRIDPTAERGASTRVRFSLSEGALVTATIQGGGRGRSFLQNTLLPPGTRQIVWDGRDAEGRVVPPGTYELRLEAVNLGGLVSPTVSQSIEVGTDTSPPESQVFVEGPAVTNRGTLLVSPTTQFRVESHDVQSGVAGIDVEFDGVTLPRVSGGMAGPFRFTTAGIHRLRFRAIDRATPQPNAEAFKEQAVRVSTGPTFFRGERVVVEAEAMENTLTGDLVRTPPGVALSAVLQPAGNGIPHDGWRTELVLISEPDPDHPEGISIPVLTHDSFVWPGGILKGNVVSANTHVDLALSVGVQQASLGVDGTPEGHAFQLDTDALRGQTVTLSFTGDVAAVQIESLQAVEFAFAGTWETDWLQFSTPVRLQGFEAVATMENGTLVTEFSVDGQTWRPGLELGTVETAQVKFRARFQRANRAVAASPLLDSIRVDAVRPLGLDQRVLLPGPQELQVFSSEDLATPPQLVLKFRNGTSAVVDPTQAISDNLFRFQFGIPDTPETWGRTVLTVSGRDLIGTLGASATTFFIRDGTPPYTTLVPSEPLVTAEGRIFLRSSVTLGFTALGPVVNGFAAGVKETRAAVDPAGTSLSGPVQAVTAPLTISVEGRYSLRFQSEDKAGNVESFQTAPLEVDNTAPTFAGTRTRRVEAEAVSNLLTQAIRSNGGVQVLPHKARDIPNGDFESMPFLTGWHVVSGLAQPGSAAIAVPAGDRALEGAGSVFLTGADIGSNSQQPPTILESDPFVFTGTNLTVHVRGVDGPPDGVNGFVIGVRDAVTGETSTLIDASGSLAPVWQAFTAAMTPFEGRTIVIQLTVFSDEFGGAQEGVAPTRVLVDFVHDGVQEMFPSGQVLTGPIALSENAVGLKNFRTVQTLTNGTVAHSFTTDLGTSLEALTFKPVAELSSADLRTRQIRFLSDLAVADVTQSQGPGLDAIEFDEVLGSRVSPAEAKTGETVTLAFPVSEVLRSTPTVTLAVADGSPRLATFTTQAGLDFIYTYAVQPQDPNGTATIKIAATDRAGNVGQDTSLTVRVLTDDVAPVVLFTPTTALLAVDADAFVTTTTVRAQAIDASRVRFRQDFNDLADGAHPPAWSSVTGDWQVVNHTFQGTAGGPNNDPIVLRAVSTVEGVGDALYQAAILPVTDDSTEISGALLFRVKNVVPAPDGQTVGLSGYAVRLVIAAQGLGQAISLEREDAGNITVLAKGDLPQPVEPVPGTHGRVPITVLARGPHLQVFVKGVGVLDATDATYAAGQVGLEARSVGEGDAVMRFDDIQVLDLEGVSGVAHLVATVASDTQTVAVDSDTVDLALTTEGRHTITVTATDRAGNVSTPTVMAVVVDTTPPTFTVSAASPAFVSAGRVSFPVRSSERLLGGGPEVRVNGRRPDAIFDALVPTVLYTVTGADPEGPAVVTVTGRDFAGNVGRLTTTGVFVVDRSTPETLVAPDTDLYPDGTETFSRPVTFTLSAIDPGRELARFDFDDPALQGQSDARWRVLSGTWRVEDQTYRGLAGINEENPTIRALSVTDHFTDYLLHLNVEDEIAGEDTSVGVLVRVQEDVPGQVTGGYAVRFSLTPGRGDGGDPGQISLWKITGSTSQVRLAHARLPQPPQVGFEGTRRRVPVTVVIQGHRIRVAPQGLVVLDVTDPEGPLAGHLGLEVGAADEGGHAARFDHIRLLDLSDLTVASGVTAVETTVASTPETVLTPGQTVTVAVTEPGAHTLSYHAVDAAGNAEPSRTVGFTVDVTPPALTLTRAAPEFLGAGPVTMIVAASEPLRPIPVGSVNGRAAVTTLPEPTSVQVVYAVTVADAEGLGGLTVTAQDRAGNVTTFSATPFEVDRTPPAAVLQTPRLAVLNPAGPPGITEIVRLPAVVSEPGTYQVTLVGPAGGTLRTLPAVPIAGGPVSVSWDGKTDQGLLVDTTGVSWKAAVEDRAGNRTEIDAARAGVPGVELDVRQPILTNLACPATVVADVSDVLVRYALHLPQGGVAPVRLTVLSSTGGVVRTVLPRADDPGLRGGGELVERWDGRDGAGRALVPGAYWLLAEAGGQEAAPTPPANPALRAFAVVPASVGAGLAPALSVSSVTIFVPGTPAGITVSSAPPRSWPALAAQALRADGAGRVTIGGVRPEGEVRLLQAATDVLTTLLPAGPAVHIEPDAGLPMGTVLVAALPATVEPDQVGLYRYDGTAWVAVAEQTVSPAEGGAARLVARLEQGGLYAVLRPTDTVAPVVGAVSAPPAFSPNADGRADTLPVAQTTTDSLYRLLPHETLTVMDAQGQGVVRQAATRPLGAATAVWTGLDATGRAVPEGRYTWALEAEDAWGNRSGVVSSTTIVDVTPPTPQFSVASPSAVVNGQIFSQPGSLVTGTGADPISGGVASGVREVRLTLDRPATTVVAASLVTVPPVTGLAGVVPEGQRTITLAVEDAADNVATQTQLLSVDGTAPQTVFTTSGPFVNDLYVSTATRIELAAADAPAGTPPVTAGVATLAYTIDLASVTVSSAAAFSLQEGVRFLTWQAVDAVQNQESLQTRTLRVDGTPPRTTLVPSRPFVIVGSQPFAQPDVTYTFTAADPEIALGIPGSGVAAIRYQVDGSSWQVWGSTPFVLAEGLRTVTFYSVDAVANPEAVQTMTIAVDGTPPATVSTIGDPQDPFRTTPPHAAHPLVLVSSQTPITLSATDPLAGVPPVAAGVASVSYRITSSGTAPGSFTTASTTTVVLQLTGRADGDYLVDYQSQDALPNVEALKTLSVTLDATPPVVQLLSPAPENVGVCQVVKGTIPVVATITDRYLATYRLEVAAGANATSGFTTLVDAGLGPTGPIATPVTAGALTVWDTRGLTGWQTVRFTATDLVQHQTRVALNIFVGDPALTQTLGASFKSSEMEHPPGRKDDVDDLDHPEGVAIAPDGTRWVADSEHDRLLAFSTGAVLLRVVTGFHEPQGIAVLSDNSALWVADRENSRLVKLTPAGQVLQTVGRVNTQGKPQAGSLPGEFNHPGQVAVDGQGRVYVADRNNQRWQRLRADGTPDLVVTLPRVPEVEDSPGRADDGGEEEAEPFGIAVTTDAGRVYVSEEESGQVLIYQVTDTTATLSGTLGGGPGTFKKPQGLATTRQNHVYVAERNANQVRKYDRFGTLVLVFGTQPGPNQEEGDDDEKGKKMAADPLRLFKPTALAVGPNGELAVAVRNDDGVKIFDAPISTTPPPAPPRAAIARQAPDLSALGPPHDFAIGPNPARAGAPVNVYFVTGWSNFETEVRVYTAAGEPVSTSGGAGPVDGGAPSRSVPWGSPAYAPGRYAVSWAPRQESSGDPLASGVYLIQLKVRNPDTGEVVPTLKKVLVIR